ncbi:MAG: hypothetical protein M1818_007632 [Claussenomyces sp. TS43310]|nr:MAG: hypothetical protein M1818_007632 [Claussenomyces sp. TS43310]
MDQGVDDEDVEAADERPPQQHLTSTLLPAPVASAVSLVTRSSALYLRLGSFIGRLALDGARVTTLTGLELSRAIVEGILSQAGRDVASRSRGELGRAEAEGLLERSIATLHSTITQISFAASTGFHISSTALSSAGDLSQHLLATLDSILGSTDSSRAIASIITLIRREFDNPATGQPGEKVGVVDLLMGVCGLALLQRWSRKLTDLDAKEQELEHVVWDVVILDDGRRADVVRTMRPGDSMSPGDPNLNKPPPSKEESASFVTTTGNEELLQTIQRQQADDEAELEGWPEASLKQSIIQTLPPDASVSISTETTTTKKITVEITGALPSDLSPPSGMEIVEENSHHVSEVDTHGESLTKEQKIALQVPRYRVVYRTIRNRLRGTNIVGGSAEPQEDTISPDAPKLEFPSSAIGQMGDDDPDSARRSSQSVPKSNEAFTLSPASSPEPRDLPGENVRPQETKRSDPVVLPLAPVQSGNQKRPRKPMSPASSLSGSESVRLRKSSLPKPALSKKVKSDATVVKKPAEKKAGLRNALRKGSGVALSSLWNKDHPATETPSSSVSKSTPLKPPFSVGRATGNKLGPSSQPIVSQKSSSFIPGRDAPRAPQRGNPNFFSSRDLGVIKAQNTHRSPSRASYYSIHEHRRDSLVSQTDTYSIHSGDTRPGSPTAFRTHLRAQSSLVHTKSEKNSAPNAPRSPEKAHQRTRSRVPSIYTLNTNNSETSLILVPRSHKSAYENQEALQHLSRTGEVIGLFPHHHLVRNVTRFVRFASASYGSSFMRVMGITSSAGTQRLDIDSNHHYEHHSFSYHTQLPASTILLSSFVDPQGGTDSTGQTNTGVPMVHFVSLDHDSRAVVLTCRGTLGFEDVLADMTCDYDDLIVMDKTYKVHKGILASALRLLSGNGSRIVTTLAAALDEFPDYGLVMCGHSLGGGVASLLAIMMSEPSNGSSAFVTSSTTYRQQSQLLITSSGTLGTAPSQPSVTLPSGRPIHVYAYGPPATLSASLRLSTRGLITTIVNGQDVVPYLSLGNLHDLQAVALAFKADNSGARGEVRARVWAGLTSGFADKWYGNRGVGASSEQDDQWAYSALKALRASMMSLKLVPPGEVFVVDSVAVLQRDAFTSPSAGNDARAPHRGLGRPATRAVLRYVRDVEKKFGELQFGGSMLLDHSPGRYEMSLAALGKGVLG